MRGFLATLIGIILVVSAIVSVPISTWFMNRSAEQMEKFWRWRALGILTLLLGVGCAVLAFVIIPTLLR